MTPICHASPSEVLEAHSQAISIFGGVFLRLAESEKQDHYQHMPEEKSHPEDDDIGYDD